MGIPIWLLTLMAGMWLMNIIAFAFWLGKLSSRVTVLEQRECKIEEIAHKLDLIALDVAVIKTELNYLKGMGS